jgi:osmotically-inducible protein OsmY
MNKQFRILTGFLSIILLGASLMAEPSSASRNDASIQQAVTHQLQEKGQFNKLQSSVEDGIVTLTGTVEVYQDKLDAAKKVRKMKDVQGVRNLIEVAGSNVPDQQLHEQLAKKLFYDRIGYYDNAFNYYTLSVKDGVVTIGGETYNDVGRDTALAIVNRMAGVKDVVNNIKIQPTSLFDDGLRIRAARAIYGDSVLGKYATDPARPIRIIVENGHISLYGTVENEMDKTIAGMRANGVAGAFSVENHLTVDSNDTPGM